MKYLTREEFEKENIFGLGNPNEGFAQYFTGNSYLNPLTHSQETVFLANVTFEPGYRNKLRKPPNNNPKKQEHPCTAARRAGVFCI